MTTSRERHVPTVDAARLPAYERWRRAFAALRDGLSNPERTDRILEFTVYANAGSMPRRMRTWLDDPSGARLYREDRRLDSRTIDLDQLAALPAGTLGHAYAAFMRSHGLTPEVFDERPSEIADPRRAYIHHRMRQTHDLWHVLTGYETDPFGEIALQAFTFAQTGARSALILAAAGAMSGLAERRKVAREVVVAYRAGRRAATLSTFAWEDHWATPLAELRQRLNIVAVQRDDAPRAMAA